jgi:hypothetical protein
MLLVRRIATDFRELRWGHVFIERVLLIMGILIALAVNGWIGDRADARSESQYLERLLVDFDRDLEVVRDYRTFEEMRVADGILAYRVVTGAEDSDRERVAEALTRLISRRTLRLALDRRSKQPDLRRSDVRAGPARIRPDPPASRQSSAAGTGSGRRFRGPHGVPRGPHDDPIWRLAADDPQRTALLGKIWYRSLASAQAINQADEVLAEVSAVRQAIVDELARRWPG